MARPNFPTMEQVERAPHEQQARWYSWPRVGGNFLS